MTARLLPAVLVLALLPQAAGSVSDGAAMTVRLTWYGWESCAAHPCRMASGERPSIGAAAGTSWLFPMGSAVTLPTGRTVTIADRGGGIDGEPWVDVFCGADAACQAEIAALGPYTTVGVLWAGW